MKKLPWPVAVALVGEQSYLVLVDTGVLSPPQ
jgi:hypothetical protein